MDYKDIGSPTGGGDNMGGIKKLFVAPLSYFSAIKTVDPAGTTLASKVEITASHDFNPGYGFHKFYVTQDKNGANAKAQGERDGKSYKQMFKGFTPGSELELHGIMSIIKNEPCIVLAMESDGKVGQIGTEDYPAEFFGEFSTGDNTPGLRGYEIEVTSVAARNYRYTGTIILYADEVGS
ncbi:MAG: hypothetical protein V4608_03320 [Bacteroidota bacterium]